jgi:hypothetical protein
MEVGGVQGGGHVSELKNEEARRKRRAPKLSPCRAQRPYRRAPAGMDSLNARPVRAHHGHSARPSRTTAGL